MLWGATLTKSEPGFSSRVSGHKKYSLGVSLSRTRQMHKGLVALGQLLLGLWERVSFGPWG